MCFKGGTIFTRRVGSYVHRLKKSEVKSVSVRRSFVRKVYWCADGRVCVNRNSAKHSEILPSALVSCSLSGEFQLEAKVSCGARRIFIDNIYHNNSCGVVSTRNVDSAN